MPYDRCVSQSNRRDFQRNFHLLTPIRILISLGAMRPTGGQSMLSTKGPEKHSQPVDLAGVYLFAEAYRKFGKDRTAMRELLGGKGAGLAEMTAAGVNVPPGMTVLTSCCR